jgi:hypothetical protein
LRSVSLLLALPLLLAAGDLRQASGRFQVTLRLPPDGLYAREEMQIEFRVQDTSRPDPLSDFAPVIRASPEAVIEMPEMAGMPKFIETAHAEGVPGDYGIHPTFAHGGAYRLILTIHPPAADAFTVEFPLDVLDGNERRKPQPSRFTLEVATARKPRAGEAVDLQIRVRDRDNARPAFEIVHEAPVHLVIVRRDLGVFAHEHPTAGDDGRFQTRYTFPSGGDYHLFADVAPKGAGSQILMARIHVAGANSGPTPVQTPPDCAVELLTAVIPSGKTTSVAFRLRTGAGEPVRDLEPYLGAAGHLMIVHEDAVTFVHSHPERDLEPQSGELRFLCRLPKPGVYRGWLQFRRFGRVQTAEFQIRAGANP